MLRRKVQKTPAKNLPEEVLLARYTTPFIIFIAADRGNQQLQPLGRTGHIGGDESQPTVH
jgi:hypothetical protein